MYPNQGFYHYRLYGTEYNRKESDTQLIGDIQKAIHSEYHAVICYDKLANLAPTQEEKNTIVEIRGDEERHLEMFSQIYRNLTGSEPTYSVHKACPETYEQGIKFFFKDEQETVDFYLDIADRAQDPIIKDRFRRAAGDEQNHAVWFLFFQKSS